ncbi:capsular associated protein [Diplodia corticola]|uniref:Capsular associated protein n=1 Tax=Diplodia corticola TaxID=236234 RepID=A0A1J9QL65_9PEZI|nr:capsular associated protein [Diplodia corticola]OJD29630.1 capsular associated protein [Diplodia corticola]
MERLAALCIAGLLACTAHLTASLDKSIALQRPVHASVAVLLIAGVALLLADKVRPLRSESAASEQQYAPIPLSDLGDANPSRPVSPSPADPPAVLQPRPTRGLKRRCALAVFLLCARIEILRQVVAGSECSTPTRETLVPVFIAVADWWLVRRRQPRHRERNGDNDNDMDTTLYSDALSGLAGSSWRPTVAIVFLAWSSTAAIARALPAKSTYICPPLSRDYTMIPRLQIAGVLLDGFLAVLLYQMLNSYGPRPGSSTSRALSCLGAACVVSALIWIVIGAGMYQFASDYARSLISPTPRHFTSSVIRLAIEASLVATCAVHSIRHFGMLNVAVLILFTAASVSLFMTTWNHSHPFPPLPGGLVLSLVGMTFSLAFYSLPEPPHSGSKLKSLSHLWGFYPIIAVLFFLQLLLVYNGDDEVRYHPIDMLMFDAKERNEHWLQWASSSISIETAAVNYTTRYKRHPPPHFDAWYVYATSRSSVIIDDFDSIHDDLLPFWSLSPAEIRQRTWEAIADPSKGIGGIFIREGKARIAPNVPRNQRLMLDSIVHIIDKFGQWLPDMDLAFNLNNECRVAVPFEDMEIISSDAADAISKESTEKDLKNDFSPEREIGWQKLPEAPHSADHFVTLSRRSTWDEFGAMTCPPSSPARSQRIWNRRDFCASCALPHTLGAFFANWTLASDICYQPDLANLHGFYTSPNTFIGTHRLMPIFSQSKAPGFNDIIYPSVWNYIDRVAYAPTDEFPDPAFLDKTPDLFWRGATSEGFAGAGGKFWHGMTRQRMVHALALSNDTQVLPLPHPVASYKRKLRYVPVAPQLLRAAIPVDVAFSDIARCGEPACSAERDLFIGPAPAPAAPDPADPNHESLSPSAQQHRRRHHRRAQERKNATPLQAHWQHRYLVDADGAGFSGRFLAFLRSRSLPLKIHPLFREWWHGRVTPWLHFVPLDPRLQGLWPTLAYFAGFKGVIGDDGGEEVKVYGNVGQGQRIAEEGRRWAEATLRREDMEVYFFRLLLEWGRLTDDGRVGLGFVPEAEGGVGGVEGEGKGEAEAEGKGEAEDGGGRERKRRTSLRRAFTAATYNAASDALKAAVTEDDHGLVYLTDLMQEDPYHPGGGRLDPASSLKYYTNRSGKLRALAGILNCHVVVRKEKVLLLCKYPASMVPLCHLCVLSGINVACIKQATPDVERAELIATFNDATDTSIDVMVSTIALVGYGLNLHSGCNTVVVAEPPTGANHVIQAIGRVYRLLQQRFCYVYVLHARNTIDRFVDAWNMMKFRPTLASVGGDVLLQFTLGALRREYREGQKRHDCTDCAWFQAPPGTYDEYAAWHRNFEAPARTPSGHPFMYVGKVPYGFPADLQLTGLGPINKDFSETRFINTISRYVTSA